MNDDELEHLFTTRYSAMVGLAMWMVGDGAMAEEIVQDAFVGLADSSRQRAIESAPAYLRTTVINLSRSRLRRVRTARNYTPRPPLYQPGPEQLLPDQELGNALAALPDRQRQCIVLRYGQDMTVKSIAKALGIGTGSVKTHLHRGLKTLGEALEPSPVDIERPTTK